MDIDNVMVVYIDDLMLFMKTDNQEEHDVTLGLGRGKCRPSKVKGSSYTGLLVTETCARTSWQGQGFRDKEQRVPLSGTETDRDKRSIKKRCIYR